jgi:protein-tyrosine phosphatase
VRWKGQTAAAINDPVPAFRVSTGASAFDSLLLPALSENAEERNPKMIRLYTSGRTFTISADLSWITRQIAIGGWIADEAAMAWVARQGVTSILNMDGIDDTKLAERYGIKVCWNHVPDDLLPKSPEVFRRGVAFARRALAKKENKLFIHCAAGFHRAPMMALAVLASAGWSLDDAMRHMRRVRPVVGFPAVYTESVRRFLRESSFEGRKKN